MCVDYFVVFNIPDLLQSNSTYQISCKVLLLWRLYLQFILYCTMYSYAVCFYCSISRKCKRLIAKECNGNVMNSLNHNCSSHLEESRKQYNLSWTNLKVPLAKHKVIVSFWFADKYLWCCVSASICHRN